MSDNSSNDEKKNREQSRYARALELAEHNTASHAIPFGEMVDGENEHPDFVVRSAQNRHRLIGIEHFQVDAGGHRKHGANQSQYKVLESEITKMQRKFADDGSFDSALKSFTALLGEYQRVHFDCGLDNFVQVFEKTLHNHLNKLESYRHTVEDLAAQEHSTYGGLALFIETRSDFSDLFLNAPHTAVRRCEQGELPMFAEILSLLREAAGSVDWILLSSGTTITDKMTSARVFDCSHDGKDWGVRPYAHYLCQMHKPPVGGGAWSYERDMPAGTVHMTYPRNERLYTRKKFFREVKAESCRAIDSMERAEPFAATLGVQMFVERFGGYLLKNKTKGRPLTVGVADRLLGFAK
ncbi:hypothetical protein [Bifidobacterium sp.]|jgi:hypothetical protein|uniref:hypothetical protein n=1 Tax=Bifidobacterium sp. TaxID=41200 RepID=UPI0025BA88F4|nr:hypothetical protein [Bifidobacterium sp.]MCI1635857.1 hypothetical protein [Bifidobacterium sp.]